MCRMGLLTWCCVPWPISFFTVKDLRPRHFKSIRAQMEHEEEGKITIKMIPDLINIPKWKDCGHNTMSKHFRDFETYLSQHYGVDGFPLDWVVRPNLPAITWGSVTTPRVQNEGMNLTSFAFKRPITFAATLRILSHAMMLCTWCATT